MAFSLFNVSSPIKPFNIAVTGSRRKRKDCFASNPQGVGALFFITESPSKVVERSYTELGGMAGSNREPTVCVLYPYLTSCLGGWKYTLHYIHVLCHQ